MSWFVIADDLSGAADCAIGFASSGAQTVVTLDAAATDVDLSQAHVLACDVDSRRVAPQEAAARNVAAWRRGQDDGRRLYKKIDSTLRGNWAAETAALLPQAGLAIVAPAFPAAGRSTARGCVIVNGKPLEDSDIWRLEGLGGRADIVALLTAQGVHAALLPLDGVRAGATAVRDSIAARAREGVQAVVCDAQDEHDLASLAEATLQLDLPAFWVGSGGLARALAALCLPPCTTPQLLPDAQRGPILTLVGSLSGVSGRQATCLCERTGMASMVIVPRILREGAGHAGWPAAQESITERLRTGADLLVSIGRDDAFDPAEGPRLSAALAQLALPGFQHAGGLIATGGETARAMLSAAGIRALRLRREVEPGVPLSDTLALPGAPARRVATKAGAFGTDAALWLAWQAMTESRAPSA